MAKALGLEFGASLGLGGLRGGGRGLARSAAIATALPAGFDPDTYLRLNPDVAARGMAAGAHYLRYGRAGIAPAF